MEGELRLLGLLSLLGAAGGLASAGSAAYACRAGVLAAPCLPRGPWRASPAAGNLREARACARAPGRVRRGHLRLCCAADSDGEPGALDREEATLVRWARAVGVDHGKWGIGAVPGGPRGAVATDDIAEGEVLVSVPRSKCMVTYAGDPCPLPASLFSHSVWERELRDDWNVKLALLLLHEQRLGHTSVWAPFIASLPSVFSTARTMPDDCLRALHDDTMIFRVRRSARRKVRDGGQPEIGALPAPQMGPAIDERAWAALEAMRLSAQDLWAGGRQATAAGSEGSVDQETWENDKWSLVCGAMNGAPRLEQFQWALDCVQSRSFAIDTRQGVKCMCLCPMADLFNHDPAAPASLDFCAENARFKLRTRCSWRQATEVRISYGNLSNADLLQVICYSPPHRHGPPDLLEPMCVRCHGKPPLQS
jgi:hypothetical protein